MELTIQEALEKIKELEAFVENEKRKRTITEYMIVPGASFTYKGGKSLHHLICTPNKDKWWLAGVRGNPFHMYFTGGMESGRTKEEMIEYLDGYTFVKFYEAEK